MRGLCPPTLAHTRTLHACLALCTLAIAHAHEPLATPHDQWPGGPSTPGWARQVWFMGLSKSDPPQVDKMTSQELTQQWGSFWEARASTAYNDPGWIATAFWLSDEGRADRLRETPDEVIKAVSPTLFKKVQMVKHEERTTKRKVTLCAACGLCPLLPVTGGFTAHTCGGCSLPVHTTFACPVARIFANPQEEGVYYCRPCAPPTALNEQLLTPNQSLKQPDFPARAVSDEHTPVGTRADAQEAIEQRLKARMEIPRTQSAQEAMEEGTTVEDPPLVGPSSNPFRPPPPEQPSPDAPPTEISHVLVSDPSNVIQLEDDFIALQFHETCRELGVPDFSEICTAVCLGKGQTGPWLIAVSAGAAQEISDGKLKSFECYTEDGEDLTLRVLPCDSYGAPIRSAASKSQTHVRQVDQKKRSDELKILLIFHLPQRCLGKSIDDPHLTPVKQRIELIANKMIGTKHSLIQGLTPKMKMKKNALYLFLNPPTNLSDPYRAIRPQLPEFRCFPYSADGLSPEPISCFMPPSMGEKIGVRTCCFRPPSICDAAAAPSGKCTFKQEVMQRWGISPTRPNPVQEIRDQRKREREASEARAESAVSAVKALRVESIKKKLCNLFSEGKVSPTPTPPMANGALTAFCPPIVRQIELQTETRLWLRQGTHRLCLRAQHGTFGPGACAPHLPFHLVGRPAAMPVSQPRPHLRVHAGHGTDDDQLMPDTPPCPRTDAGSAVLRQGRAEGEQGLPLSPWEPNGGGLREINPQQSSVYGSAGASFLLRALRIFSRLALGPTSGQRANECASRGWLHECDVRPMVPRTQTSIPPIRPIRHDRGRAPPPYGPPHHVHRSRMDYSFRHGRSQCCHVCVRRRRQIVSPSLTYCNSRVYPPTSVPRLLINIVPWHSLNILWLQGRLPWNITRICLS